MRHVYLSIFFLTVLCGFVCSQPTMAQNNWGNPVYPIVKSAQLASATIKIDSNPHVTTSVPMPIGNTAKKFETFGLPSELTIDQQSGFNSFALSSSNGQRPTVTRGGAFVRSFLVPGWGQFSKGNKVRGWLFLVYSLGAASYTAMQHISRSNALDEYNAATDRYDNAIDEQTIAIAYADMERYWQKFLDKGDSRETGLYVFGGVWLVSLIDSLFGFGQSENGMSMGLQSLPSSGLEPAVRLRIGY